MSILLGPESTSKDGSVIECSTCKNWLCQRVTDYANGERIINFSAPEGEGLCEVLKINTSKDFSCTKYKFGTNHIEIMGKKTGSPWHHSHWGTCPDCQGVGLINNGSCKRCAQTGRVLYYDDGYVGEEQTRRHPNEIQKGPPPTPKCQSCDKAIELTWFACPYCGSKVPKPEDPIRVAEFL